jgi:hypothetical protein
MDGDTSVTPNNGMGSDLELVDGESDSTYPLSRPEAVVQAMRVLQVHKQLEEDPPSEQHDDISSKLSIDEEFSHDENDKSRMKQKLGDGEKALLREMCNVSVSRNSALQCELSLK